mgnify:FL=1
MENLKQVKELIHYYKGLAVLVGSDAEKRKQRSLEALKQQLKELKGGE